MAGRPTSLTPKAQRQIVKAIKSGLTQKDAAKSAGVSDTTFYNWIERAKTGEPLYVDFLDAITHAKEEAQATLADYVMKAAKGGQKLIETKVTTKPDGTVEESVTVKKMLPDWRAAIEILGRRHSDQWGRKDNLKVELDWRDELEKKGVDPDAAINQLADTLRPVITERSDESGTDETGDSEG